MTVNERILSIIKSEKGLTQKGMGQAIGVSPSTVNNWMKLQTPIPAEYIVSIAEYLCVSPLYLLTGKDEDKVLPDADSEWLSLIHQLPEDVQHVFLKQIEGYLNIEK